MVKNSMWIKSRVKTIVDNLNGDILPQIEKNVTHDGEIYIKPSNIMYVKSKILPPSLITKRIYPLKDSLVIKSNALLNYGKSITLGIQNNTDEIQSYLTYSLEDLPSDIIFKSAKLCVYKKNFTSDIFNMHINETSNIWSEIGINWNNKPSTSSLLKDISIPPDIGYINLDVTEYTKSWYNSDDKIKSFNISTDYSDVLNNTTYFDSREANNKPYIEVQYYSIPDNVGLYEFKGDILPSAQKTNEVDGEIFVTSGFRETILNGEIFIKDIQNQISIDGDIVIAKSVIQTYDGEIDIIAEKNDICTDGEILPIITKRYMYNGEIYVDGYSLELYFDGNISPQLNKEKYYDANINIISEYQDIDFNGQILPQLNNNKNIDGFIEILNNIGQAIFDGSVLPKLNKEINYNGEILIIQSENFVHFNGEILPSINQIYDFDGEINIISQNKNVDYYGEIYSYSDSSKIFDGEIFIKINEFEIESDGEISVNLKSNENTYDGEISVIFKNQIETIVHDINIIKITRETTINGEIEPAIKSYTFYDGEIEPFINRSVFVGGEIYIPKPPCLVGFNGEISVIVLKKKGKSYGYIM